jgi:hypothetical protein
VERDALLEQASNALSAARLARAGNAALGYHALRAEIVATHRNVHGAGEHIVRSRAFTALVGSNQGSPHVPL